MDRKEIKQWLQEADPDRLEQLWEKADRVRRETVGDAVHLRGLIEISNHCVRQCGYCGLRVNNTELERYRMPEEEILDCANNAVEFGYGTVVMQAGEDYGITTEWLGDIVQKIKTQTPLAVTLSMGERPESDFVAWRRAGADRYLLRFETSDSALYEKIHPKRAGQDYDRFDCLKRLKDLGYEVGSGVMIGIPGQSWETLANDVALFGELDLDMIGVGPFIAHPGTPLGNETIDLSNPDQVPNSELMCYKVMALTRLIRPDANIPSTTALATINTESGRELGLSRGANVVMPNLTPVKYRRLYEIYPAKACIGETAKQCRGCLFGRIESIGRYVGQGPGNCIRRSND